MQPAQDVAREQPRSTLRLARSSSSSQVTLEAIQESQNSEAKDLQSHRWKWQKWSHGNKCYRYNFLSFFENRDSTNSSLWREKMSWNNLQIGIIGNFWQRIAAGKLRRAQMLLNVLLWPQAKTSDRNPAEICQCSARNLDGNSSQIAPEACSF